MIRLLFDACDSSLNNSRTAVESQSNRSCNQRMSRQRNAHDNVTPPARNMAEISLYALSIFCRTIERAFLCSDICVGYNCNFDSAPFNSHSTRFYCQSIANCRLTAVEVALLVNQTFNFIHGAKLEISQTGLCLHV